MKNLFASRTALSAALWLFSAPAWAGPAADGLTCLHKADLPCAQMEVLAARQDEPDDVQTLLLEAELAFHEGRFSDAADFITRVSARESELDPQQKARLGEQRGFYLGTAEVTADMVETTVDNVVVLHHPGIERILVDDAVDAINLARERIAPALGGDLPFPVRVELYPDTASFIVASGLPQEAVATTGVVAISKYNRLIVSSPRALGRGYGWRDTIVHEWIHLVVSYNSKENAPIWLQEGIAKGTDMLWREDGFVLDTQKQALLAGALDTGDFVTFEQMHPSMAYLPSAEMAALAYAQVATMMEYLQVSTDRQALARVVELVGDGVDPKVAVAKVAGMNFDAFEFEWKRWLGTLELSGYAVASMPTVLGEGTDFDYDPVLSRRKDLANRARLGDLMAAQGHREAALMYYQQARPEEGPLPPHVALSMARVYIDMGDVVAAMQLLEDSREHYPEVAENRKALGELYASEGRDGEAIVEYRASVEINPFDAEVQRALAELYQLQGKTALAQRHAAKVRVLLYTDT